MTAIDKNARRSDLASRLDQISAQLFGHKRMAYGLHAEAAQRHHREGIQADECTEMHDLSHIPYAALACLTGALADLIVYGDTRKGVNHTMAAFEHLDTAIEFITETNTVSMFEKGSDGQSALEKILAEIEDITAAEVNIFSKEGIDMAIWAMKLVMAGHWRQAFETTCRLYQLLTDPKSAILQNRPLMDRVSKALAQGTQVAA